MRSTLTISLPQNIKRDLDKAAREEGLARSDLVRESLRDYLYIRKFRSLRARLLSKLARRGGLTDEDVFDVVS
jgi:metal-responsive CopG/Arc/MetJ family transcriptional regulator